MTMTSSARAGAAAASTIRQAARARTSASGDEPDDLAVVLVGQQPERAVRPDPHVAEASAALEQPLLADHALAVEREPRDVLAAQAADEEAPLPRREQVGVVERH